MSDMPADEGPICPKCGKTEDAAFKLDCPCAWVDEQLLKHKDPEPRRHA